MADLEALKQALPIEQVVGEYVQLRKAGATYKGLCPFHMEKTPSFTVSPERGSFRCFGCGKGGDIVTFLMEIEKVDFKEALRRLGRKAGITVQVDRPQPPDPEKEEVAALNEAAGLFFQAALASPGGAEARAYLERRGISRASIERFGLGWAPAGWDHLLRHLAARRHAAEALARAGLVIHHQERGSYYDRFRNRLIFPIRDAKGLLTGFGGRELDGSTPKYLNSPQTKLFDKGSVLYLLDAAQEPARKAGRIVVVEGYLDALMAHQAGFADVVAGLGTALTDRQLRLLHGAARRIVMALDADPAGQKAMQQTVHLAYRVFERRQAPQLSGRLASERAPGAYRGQVEAQLCIAALPEGRDPDEVIRADPAAWRVLVEEALPVVEFFFALLARGGLGAAERRQRANEDLLPIVAEVPDPLERGQYVDRLATLLEVPESVVLSAVEQLRRAPVRPDGATGGRGDGGTARAGDGAMGGRAGRPGAGGRGPGASLPEAPTSVTSARQAVRGPASAGERSTGATGGEAPPWDEAPPEAAIDYGPGDLAAEGEAPEEADIPTPPRRSMAFLPTGERTGQRYILSMLLRYPRAIAAYAEALAALRPEDERLGAAWEYVLTHPEARTYDDLAEGLGDDERVTAAYLAALLRDTADLEPLDEPRLRVALDHAVALLRRERVRREIARHQARLGGAAGQEIGELLATLDGLRREKAALDRAAAEYNRERAADAGAGIR